MVPRSTTARHDAVSRYGASWETSGGTLTESHIHGVLISSAHRTAGCSSRTAAVLLQRQLSMSTAGCSFASVVLGLAGVAVCGVYMVPVAAKMPVLLAGASDTGPLEGAALLHLLTVFRHSMTPYGTPWHVMGKNIPGFTGSLS